jgi:hypothetical protein
MNLFTDMVSLDPISHYSKLHPPHSADDSLDSEGVPVEYLNFAAFEHQEIARQLAHHEYNDTDRKINIMERLSSLPVSVVSFPPITPGMSSSVSLVIENTSPFPMHINSISVVHTSLVSSALPIDDGSIYEFDQEEFIYDAERSADAPCRAQPLSISHSGMRRVVPPFSSAAVATLTFDTSAFCATILASTTERNSKTKSSNGFQSANTENPNFNPSSPDARPYLSTFSECLLRANGIVAEQLWRMMLAEAETTDNRSKDSAATLPKKLDTLLENLAIERTEYDTTNGPIGKL